MIHENLFFLSRLFPAAPTIFGGDPPILPDGGNVEVERCGPEKPPLAGGGLCSRVRVLDLLKKREKPLRRLIFKTLLFGVEWS